MEPTHHWNAWLGTDESGKGDYFGPLVVAGVYVDIERCEALKTYGIADGKTLSNRRVCRLAKFLWDNYEPYIATVEKMPTEYNALYSAMRQHGQNQHHLLAALHAEVIQTLAERHNSRHAIVDKFDPNGLITSHLASSIEVTEIHKAERHDIAVAAASIIARARFLIRIGELSRAYKIELPRGSYKVTQAGRDFIKAHGTDALGKVAKLHFRLTGFVTDSEEIARF